MTVIPVDLEGARILVTNDDGYSAAGIAVLTRIARTFTDDVWVVAPETNQSGTGHSLTLQRPLRLREVEERRFAVDGTPTDCVLLAVNVVLKDKPPALVLSGVNQGYNLAEDVRYSGTISAAMEGMMLGIPSIALSQFVPPDGKAPWDTAETHAPDLIRRICAAGWPTDTVISVNFPACGPEAVTGVRATAQGRQKTGDQIVRGTDPRGRSYFWVGAMLKTRDAEPGSDVAAVAENAISVTPVALNATDRGALETLKGVLG